ncbi:MAG TPA: L-threonylcarbamoyladenylate synthase [Burkholderiales bacterium]|nr:L-threonylcarbamoyladenylate synthase [Burkholderiales bacterium]
MAQYFVVHALNPQRRLIRRAVEVLRSGGLIVYPTDSCYALGCRIGEKEAMERLRRIRGIGASHHLTLVCRDLSEIAQYARVDNGQYRLLRNSTPGSYTFILQATREVPKRLLNPKRKTIGLRVPEHAVARALLEELGEPILSSTLILPGDAYPLTDGVEIRAKLEHQVDLVLDAGSCGLDMTTVIDLTGDTPVVVRVGKGPVAPFAAQPVQ